jgi:hypothetical protein
MTHRHTSTFKISVLDFFDFESVTVGSFLGGERYYHMYEMLFLNWQIQITWYVRSRDIPLIISFHRDRSEKSKGSEN